MRARYLIATIALVFVFQSARAGAWLQPVGHGQYINQISYYSNNEYFGIDGNRIRQPRFTKYEFQPYVEYGLLDNLTVGGTAFIQRVDQSGINNTGIADPEIFGRTELWKTEIDRISLQSTLKLKSMFVSNGTPRGGSKSTDIELSALYGRNLNIISAHDYLDARAGYRHRTGTLNDQIIIDAAVGLEASPGWFVIPAVRTITATSYGDTTIFSENGGMDYDLIKLELGTTCALSSGQTVGLTAFSHVMGAQTGNGMGAVFSFTQGF